MTSFKVVNNATTIINNNLILDPWIYGDLYHNSWSPESKDKYPIDNLKKIKMCFISHIHADHWDIDTIKYFNKNVSFFIPRMGFNIIIEKKLNELGFNNVNYLEVGKFTKVSDSILSTIGTARGTTQASCLPFASNSTFCPLTSILSCFRIIDATGLKATSQ